MIMIISTYYYQNYWFILEFETTNFYCFLFLKIDDRAKEAYNKYLRDQQEKKAKDEDERKRRAEL